MPFAKVFEKQGNPLSLTGEPPFGGRLILYQASFKFPQVSR